MAENLTEKVKQVKEVRIPGRRTYELFDEKTMSKVYKHVALECDFVFIDIGFYDSGLRHFLYFPAEDLMSDAIN